jgi:hypothetical protein
MTCLVGSIDGIIWTPDRPKGGSPNLYVEVSVDESVVQSTAVMMEKQAPVWDQEFIMCVRTRYSSLLAAG